MFTTAYITDEGVVVSVLPHTLADGGARIDCKVMVATPGGRCVWMRPDLQVPRSWSSERIAREAWAWAQATTGDELCECGRPDCGARDLTGADIFRGDPEGDPLEGPFLCDPEKAVDDAVMIAAMQKAGIPLEAPETPTIAELLADLDRKPRPPKATPPDPHDGGTWNLG